MNQKFRSALKLALVLPILAAVAAYLFNMGPVPTHPPQNGSIIQMEPRAGVHS